MFFTRILFIRYVNINVNCIVLYILRKCVQSYTSVKTVLLRAIPTVIRTYYYDQYYGSDLSLLKITYLLPYIRVNLGVCQDISSLAQQ